MLIIEYVHVTMSMGFNSLIASEKRCTYFVTCPPINFSDAQQVPAVLRNCLLPSLSEVTWVICSVP